MLRTTVRSGKTAIGRTSMSAPVNLLLSRELLEVGKHVVFDYGCGRGQDMIRLRKLGFKVAGWDPNHHIAGYSIIGAPDESTLSAYNWYHCGYVLNVVEDAFLRLEIVKHIHALVPRGGSASFAVRTARDIVKSKTDSWNEYSDGWVTSKDTFQHGFTPAELFLLLDEVGFSQVGMIKRHPLIMIGVK